MCTIDDNNDSNMLVDKIKMIDEVEVGEKIVMNFLERNTKADVIDNIS